MNALSESVMALTEEGVLQYEHDSGKVLYANRSLMALLENGESNREVAGSPVTALLPGNVAQEINRRIATEAEIRGLQYTQQPARGGPRILSIDARLSVNEEGKNSSIVLIIRENKKGEDPDQGARRIVEDTNIGFAEDFTAYKTAGEQLRQSEGKYRLIVENQTDLVVKVDTKGRLQFASPTYCDMFGKSERELLGTRFMPLFLEGDGEKTAESMENLYTPPYRCYVEQRTQTEQGWRWIGWSGRSILDDHGNVIAIIGSGRDITERKNTEIALFESQKRYFSLFEYSPIAFWEEDMSEVKNYLDKLKKRGVKHIERYLQKQPEMVKECLSLVKVLDTNKATIDQFEAANKDHILADLKNIFLDETYKPFITELAAIYRGETSQQFRTSAITLKGKKLDRIIKWAVLPGYEDTYSKVLVSEIDITEQERIVQELERSQDQLRRLSAHLESVREEERKAISREIHDELGQSLTALKMDLAWLNRKTTEADRSIPKKIRSMNTLVDDTIRTVKKISAYLRPALIDDLGLPAAIEWYAGDFGERTGIPCLTSIEPEDILVGTDIAITLYRILQEALTNVARHSRATRVRVILREDNEQLLLRVHDNGIGITEDEKNATSALGLLGMKERIHFLGGSIAITGKPGKGTTVRVSVPAG